MRSKADRIRHALGFEIIGLVLVIGFGDWLFGLEPAHFGPLALLFSVLATVWNYYYNRAFDGWLLKRRGSVVKRQADRVLHAVMFEGGLLLVTLPVIAWWLDMSLWQALVADIAMVVFYLLYAYLYNLAYDWLFPASKAPVPAR
ncbi:membrane protein [Marinobacterium nitratireducens]|uniref:Membrane protein n=1 Tax=Marinobacterium nitratireducens TaxID=518897 RepID=A0A918DX60_9GAMM|nr:PACE efflux transporter [Marinobacterium nitratireducens]GGO86764.1 membrane protein [Marinobacterium nitratireducens]